jgi:hypothetical protein
VSFDDCTGVVGDESAEMAINVMGVSKVAGPIEGVEARINEIGGITDVVEPSAGFQQVGPGPQDGGERASLAGYALGVCPAAGERRL